MSPKRPNLYSQVFAGRHYVRDPDALSQVRDTVARTIGRNLVHRVTQLPTTDSRSESARNGLL